MTELIPAYSKDALADCSAGELLQLLIRDEDRVPRDVIDECARRGDEMVELLAELPRKPYYWSDDQTPGEWWLWLHAVMILGLIPSERPGELLTSFMRRMDEADDTDLQDWLSGFWPALFRNKPDGVLPNLRALAEDRARGWYIRVNALEAVLARAHTSDAGALDSALAWAAGLAFDANEDLDMRLMTGNLLLDFARPEYRQPLQELADLQPRLGRVFDRSTIEETYASGEPELQSKRPGEPWDLYTREAIEERLRYRAEEEARFEAAIDKAASSVPSYTEESLGGRSADELLQLLVRDRDRVRRNVIDECARRGDEMLDLLSRVLDDGRYWRAQPRAGEWWLVLHAIMILGLMPSERAGSLLAGFARRLTKDDDELLQSWVTGTWHALFGNKPPEVMPELRELAHNEDLEGEFRAEAAQAYVRLAQGLDGAKVEDALRWIAAIAFDENTDHAARHPMGAILIDFPRPQYRSGLETLAREDRDTFPYFYEDDVEQAYAPPLQDHPRWYIHDDPWSFYTLHAIVERQDQWEGLHPRRDDADFAHPPEQYVRAAPKVGRNDPCPCGSGKKYKKCCLK